VISLFQQGFVKTGRMDPTIAKALPRAFEKRQKTDYGDFATLTDAELQHIRQEVAAFVAACVALLERMTGGSEVPE